jgi:short-subunit dehydrogenase
MPETRRTLVVTGASSGIGRALALEAAAADFDVVMVARRGTRLEEAAKSIRAAGGSSVIVAGDVTAREMPARIVEAALNGFGRIDVVVNNAGAGAYGTLLEQSDAEMEAQWQLNVAAPLRLARAALEHLAATRGQLVFIGSGVARIPLPRQGPYALTKAAIRAAAIQLRRELRSQGIAVTYVDPGVVATEFHSSLGVDRPPGPIAAPERVARSILRGIRRRRAVIHAVPWQAAFTTIGEWSGTLTDPVVSRFYSIRRTREVAPVEPCHPERRCEAPESKDRLRAAGAESNDSIQESPFERALEPVARRMERVKLPQAFLRDALVPDTTLELNALAMRWAGMPNKNERAVLREALDMLAAGGYLERMEDETWRVVRSAD